MAYLKTIYRRATLLAICSLVVYTTFSPVAFGQRNYIIVKKEDAQEFLELPRYVPDARIGGSFRYTTQSFLDADKKLPPRKQHDKLALRLDFRSEFHRKLELKLSVANALYLGGVDLDSYYEYSEIRQEDGLTAPNALFFVEGYLDYNFIAGSTLRVGKQQVSLGARKGFIFSGYGRGARLLCKVGTWCYDVGLLEMGEKSQQRLAWFQILYPIYNSGRTIPAFWEDKEIDADYLSIEGFNIYHSSRDVPLSTGGATTWYADNAGTHSPYQVKNGDKYVSYLPNMRVWGVNLDWRKDSWFIGATYMRQDGTRKYTSVDASGDSFTQLGQADLFSSLIFVQTNYRIAGNHRIHLEAFTSTGEDPNKKDTPLWEQEQTGFYSFSPGATSGGANLYFGADTGTGFAHRITNLTYYKLGYSYIIANQQDLRIDFDLYNFSRTRAVLNENGDTKSAIGSEVNIGVTWRAEKTFEAEWTADMFMPDGAFSPHDDILPAAEVITTFYGSSLRLSYTF